VTARGWIGVDLDGTFAFYDGWKGERHIGPPIPAMLERVKQWRAMGIDVRIFTARASATDPDELREVVTAIDAYCLEHVGETLPVTCTKDYQCMRIYDDRAVQVEFNTGRLIEDAAT
jgi:hypothetical protein